MVPEGIGGRVHEEQASVSQLQLHGIDLSAAPFPSSISVSKDKVSSCSQRDGSDGTGRVQLLLVVPMLPHVILSIFVPGGDTEASDMSNSELLD